MADNKNDVTTRFKVDISDLKKNIAEANRQIKLANATFKSETGGMSDWAKSVDGVSAKLKQLDSTLDAQKAKLDAYREQFERQKAVYDENAKRADELRAKLQELTEQGISEASEEYQKYRAALQETEKQQEASRVSLDNLQVSMLNQEGTVKGVQAEIDSYSAVLSELQNNEDSAGKSADDLGENTDKAAKSAEDAEDGFTAFKAVLADLASTAIKAVVDGLKEMATAAANAWKEYDAGADTIKKATGATGEAADELIGSYENLSHTVKGSFEDIGTAIGEVNTRFGSTGDELESLSEKFLKFSQLNGTDVKKSIDDVQSVMASFGMDTADAAAFLDTLNKAGQDTGISMDSLLSSLKSNSAALGELGMSTSDSVMLLAELEKNGVDTSTAMTGLKKAMQNAIKDGTPLSEAMGGITDSIKNAETETEAMSAAAEVFGSKAAPAMAKAIRDGRLSFEAAGTSMSDYAGSVDDTYKSIMSANDMLDLAVQNIKLDIASMLDEFLNGHIEEIEEAVQGLTGSLIPAFKNLLGGAEGAEKEMSKIIGDMLSGTVKKITSGLPQFVKTGSEILKNLIKGLSESLPELLKAATNVFRELLDINAQLLPELVSSVTEIVPDIVDALLDRIPELVQGAVKFFEAIIQAIPVLIPKLTEAIPQIVTSVSETLEDLIPVLIDGAITLFMAITEALPQIITELGKAIPKLVIACSELLVQNAPALLKGATKLFMASVEAIPTVIKELAKALAGIPDEIMRGLYEPVTNIFGRMWNTLTDGAVVAWEKVKEVFSKLADFFGSIFRNAWEKVKEVFSTGGTLFKGISEGILKAFTSIVNKLIEGINTVVSVPFEGINNLLNKIRDTDVMGIKPFAALWNENPLKTPRIPLLARGGVLRRGQVGLLEGTGAEAVVPLEQNKAWIKAVADELHASTTGISLVGSAELNKLIEELTAVQKAISGNVALSAGAVSDIRDISGKSFDMLGSIAQNTAGMNEMGVYINSKALIGQIAPDIDRRLGLIASARIRGN